MGKKSLGERLSDSWSRPEAQDSAKRFAKFLLVSEEAVNRSGKDGLTSLSEASRRDASRHLRLRRPCPSRGGSPWV
jgi:hypothetical protein